MKKNFSIKKLEQNIKNNETFFQSNIIPIDALSKQRLYYKKISNISTTERNNESKEKINSFINSKFKYHKKLSINSPKIILDLCDKESVKYNGHISPKIPKIIFQNGDLPQYHGKNKPLYNNNITNKEKKYNYKKYNNKIIINNIFGINKENDMNYSNINYNGNFKQNKKINSNLIPKGKNNIKKRNNINNYSKQITHFALKKGNKNNNNYQYNNHSILGLISPRNNNEIVDKAVKKYYKSSNKNKELAEANVTLNNKKNSKVIFEQFNIKKMDDIKLEIFLKFL